MSQDWGLFTNDSDDETSMRSLLPSSLRDVWGDPEPVSQFGDSTRFPRSPSPQNRGGFPESGSFSRHQKPFPFAESAPALSFMDDIDGAVPTYEPQIVEEPVRSDADGSFYLVQFHPNRTDVLKWCKTKPLEIGDYVVTEADRGYDVGVIVEWITNPSSKELRNAKIIVRKASKHEISQLPLKASREAKAVEICVAKAMELQLPMEITGAEFQFDGKKLTFYYTASSYIDFRGLVRSLYKNFGMRIWMVWHDGNAPVRDVLHRNEQRH